MAHMRISGTTKATELIFPTAFAFTHRVYKKTLLVGVGREPNINNIVNQAKKYHIKNFKSKNLQKFQVCYMIFLCLICNIVYIIETKNQPPTCSCVHSTFKAKMNKIWIFAGRPAD
jgi:hypothetical protein